MFAAPLRKAISILLLGLLLYNLVGYQLLFYWRTQALEQEISSTIDQGEVDESQLLVFKVPVPVYHQTDKDFERAEGSFEYQGHYYEMVKWKLENDTIYTYCLRNEQKRVLVDKLSDHVETHVTDLKSSKPSKPEKPLPSLLKEYLSQSVIELPALEGGPAAMGATPYQVPFSAPSLSLSTPPPETIRPA